jgi:pimeloyl-ACP methyl ester carboxylesterase
MATTVHTLDIEGGRLHYEVRGSGPVLLIVGAPMSAAFFAPLADAMAAEYTVITHDPRGIAGSVLDDPDQDSTPQLRANDVALLLDSFDVSEADFFGSSGGAVTGLAFATQYPGRVRTLVAHEPPLLELLPDAAAQRTGVDEMVEAYHRDGPGAAWAKFMAAAGFDTGDEGAPVGPPGEQSEQDLADGARFFLHELRGTTRYIPDIDALVASDVDIVVGIGAESGGLSTYRTSTALAELLGAEPVTFPGDHGGFIAEPAEFAEVLRKVLAVPNA